MTKSALEPLLPFRDPLGFDVDGFSARNERLALDERRRERHQALVRAVQLRRRQLKQATAALEHFIREVGGDETL
jgi:hypothetical protein